MEGGAAGGGGSGSGGGPAPFLLKTYEMVDDSATDDIVSWSQSRISFVVWNPPEFARLLLPTYFKHNNFSSFIRQLNTYGFRKIDPERWEFANEDFVKDQKHLLKNIHRRKPIHSHSNPQGSSNDPERASFEEEIDKLSQEKAALEGQLLQFKQQASGKVRLEELTERVGSIERRQECLGSFLEKAVQDPDFVERLNQKLESMDFSAYNKKRRLPQTEHFQPVKENVSVDDHSSSKSGSIFHQDFSNKLRLELSPAVSDINLLSHSTQSSNEDGGSPQRRISERWSKDMNVGTGGVSYDLQALELSDTGASFTLTMDSSLPCKTGCPQSPRLHSLQQSTISDEECDGLSCQLNLSLASSPLQINKSPHTARIPEGNQELGKYVESRPNTTGNETEPSVPKRSASLPSNEAIASSTHDVPSSKQGPATGQARVNDVFWEQFLTERPGSDTEEASTGLRAPPYIDCEERRSFTRQSDNTKSAEHLTL